jgi:hypothetical protein
MRIIVSILLNAKENLLHNDYYKKVPSMCDYWIIAEGASQSNGSTRWCKTMPEGTHINGRSSDGTFEFLTELAKENHKIIVLSKEVFPIHISELITGGWGRTNTSIVYND